MNKKTKKAFKEAKNEQKALGMYVGELRKVYKINKMIYETGAIVISVNPDNLTEEQLRYVKSCCSCIKSNIQVLIRDLEILNDKINRRYYE